MQRSLSTMLAQAYSPAPRAFTNSVKPPAEQNSPAPELRAYQPSLIDLLGSAVAGDGRSSWRRSVADAIVGSTGLGVTNHLAPGALAQQSADDWQSYQDQLGRGDYGAAAQTFAGVMPLGTFVGARAHTADLNKLADALSRLRDRAPRADVLKDTGWARGADTAPRFEIPDHNSRLTDYARLRISNPSGVDGPLSKLLEHPALYRAHPDIADIQTRLRYDPHGGMDGGYDRLADTIDVQSDRLDGVDSLWPSLLHEVQHAVQKREGFARGGNSADFPNAEDYFRLMGENEARLTQYRRNMSDTERASPTNLPWLPRAAEYPHPDVMRIYPYSQQTRNPFE